MFKRFILPLTFMFALLFTQHLAADQNIFIFLGAPGAGKGTISKKLSDQLHIPHISTGDLLRIKSKEKGDLAQELNSYVTSGELVPDEVIMKILNERVQKEDCKNGFVLDGFPRTLSQAKQLDQQFTHKDQIVVINVLLGTNTILERLQGRRICGNCSKSYHITFNPPESKNKCDDCGQKLISRADDTIETIQKRLEIYQAQFAPIKRFYKESYQWIDVKNESAEECFNNLVTKVDSINSELLRS